MIILTIKRFRICGSLIAFNDNTVHICWNRYLLLSYANNSKVNTNHRNHLFVKFKFMQLTEEQDDLINCCSDQFLM